MGILSAGCVAGEHAGRTIEDVGVVEDALECGNALNLNALNLNALNLNALNLNALSPGAMSAGDLEVFKSADSRGELARQLLSYTVSCALATTQSFELEWTDELGTPRLSIYWGLMALAPGWADGPLSNTEQRWISACLASRVNWYGTPVLLSSRGPHESLSPTQLSEVLAFPMMEGAFWGDLFGDSPKAYACHDAPNAAHSREKLRDCAAGHIDGGDITNCGLIDIVGPCQAHCAPTTVGDGHYESCSADAAAVGNTEVVTVWLPI